jgi:ferritin-like metal-binding protein YciE
MARNLRLLSYVGAARCDAEEGRLRRKKGSVMAHNEMYIAWLNDAYATEQALIKVLENHVKDAEGHPQLHMKIQQHLEQTRQHGELVKSCIERLGGSTSGVKSGLASVMGMMQGISTGAAKDELVKDGLQDFAAENFEIASYQGLISAAQFLGDTETARICQQILAQEQAMASFLQQQLPMAVQEVLQQAQASHAEGSGVQAGTRTH